MTREERAEHSKRICQNIARKVGEISPMGLGHWSNTWDFVEVPSGRFLDALGRWVDEDTSDTRSAVQEAGDALLVSWADAGDRYRLLQGSPGREVGHVL